MLCYAFSINKFYSVRIALVAFSTARISTPTSPKTASHMSAIPNAARIRIRTFTPIANAMFSLTIFMVLLAMPIAFGTPSGSSSMSTTSAASIAASLPIAPIAIPISARMRTGASLIPSPTKATLPTAS